jgi:hypothetical protein
LYRIISIKFDIILIEFYIGDNNSLKTPEAKGLLLAEGEGVLRRYFSETHDAGSAYPRDGRAEAVAAVGELIKSAEKKSTGACGLGPPLARPLRQTLRARSQQDPFRDVVILETYGQNRGSQHGTV